MTKLLPNISCANCGIEFRPRDSTKKYCSRACVPPLTPGRKPLPPRPFTEADIASRSEFVTETGCRLWNGSVSNRGYGVMKMKCARFGAHRVAWSIVNGEIPAGYEVMHKCDTPTCVNADHLRLGTHAENMKDRDNKGRGNPWGRKTKLTGVRK